jgi:predicted negative regulator of RcsB-dependent stress response
LDKQLRTQIKHDRFVEEVGHTVEYLQGHRSQVRKYGSIGAAVLVAVIAIYGFMSWRKSSRQEELRQASILQDAFVGEQAPPTGGKWFKTQAEKDSAALKAFSDVAAKNSGSKEGQLAQFYASTILCDQGKVPECEAGFKQVAEGSDAEVASLAKLSLTEIYQSQGKVAEAENYARQLLAKPTVVVSKEQAQIALARAIAKSKPQEARILLEALQALDRPAVTRAAVAVLGEMSGSGAPR